MKKTSLFLASFAFAWLTVAATPGHAKLKVVTTLPSFADIAKNVAGDDANVIALTKGTQDPHFVDAKPDLILDLHRADLLIRAGLGLEDGWLPPLVTGARNGDIQVGSKGDFDVSTVMKLREVPKGPLDRSMGDVHPGGNPHYMVDPRNGVVFAKAVAKRLAELEPSKAAAFEKRANEYSSMLEKKIEGWNAQLKPVAGKQIVTYHKSWIYFSAWAGLDEAGYVEPKPGIPPSPEHIVTLSRLMKEKKVKVILMEPFYPKGAAEEVAHSVGARLYVLPVEVNGSAEAKTYADVFEQIVKALTQAQWQ